ncbi:uncharacterized protein N7483_003463 [Penicillium malachiteum]|uniref:uncharacterized protein n=1 Tax=Penicillium malachiteum TaxID=1324776 RepID=UPI0025473BF5|nr:uncharacterized protein N7483_003463 [Penicillium malachiteum]KAJ5728955.1 hypothetical protein N7483_003463 [Penicillium malachiteum]
MTSNATSTTLPIRGSAPASAPKDEDSDYTSSSGSSCDSSSEDDSSEDENGSIHHENRTSSSATSSSIPHVHGRPKPRIRKMEGNSELLARLSAFLPKMKSANEDLEKEIAEGRGKDVVLDEVDDGKDYIEMNLGLGVLEEKRGENGDSSGDERDHEGMDGVKSDKKSNMDEDSDILGKLMGHGGKDLDADKPSIEDLGQ